MADQPTSRGQWTTYRDERTMALHAALRREHLEPSLDDQWGPLPSEIAALDLVETAQRFDVSPHGGCQDVYCLCHVAVREAVGNVATARALPSEGPTARGR